MRENTLTFFNLILLAFAAALVAVGEYADLLFVGIVVINASIGILQGACAPSGSSIGSPC